MRGHDKQQTSEERVNRREQRVRASWKELEKAAEKGHQSPPTVRVLYVSFLDFVQHLKRNIIFLIISFLLARTEE